MADEKEKKKNPDFILVDATNAIIGRLASVVAKWLLLGKRVVIINAEKAVITGKLDAIMEELETWWNIRGSVNPERAPKHYVRPDLFLKRKIRGMLPWKQAKGRLAYKRLRVYIGCPIEFRKLKPVKIPEADASKLRCKYFQIGEILKRFGWKGISEWKVPLK